MNMTAKATRNKHVAAFRAKHGPLRRAQLDAQVRVYGKMEVTLAAGSSISVGRRTVFNSVPSLNTLMAHGPNILRTLAPHAEIEIGEFCGFTSATVSAAVRVTIGPRSLIGPGTLITDSDHHPVDLGPVPRRFRGFPASDPSDAVSVGEDVFIGARAIILKGVTIGDGSVVGAGSVVTRSIPEGVIAAGNPCRVIREVRSC